MNLFGTFLIVGLLVMAVVAAVAILSAIQQAPTGREDQTGFHSDSADSA